MNLLFCFVSDTLTKFTFFCAKNSSISGRHFILSITKFKHIEVYVGGTEVLSRNKRPFLAFPTPSEPSPNKVWIVDGGIRHTQNEHWTQTSLVWIGDSDSTTPKELEQLKSEAGQRGNKLHLIQLPTEKDISDLGATLQNISGTFSNNEALFADFFGTAGGRFDHAIIVFQEIFNWVQSRTAQTLAMCDFGIVSNTPFAVYLEMESVFSIVSTKDALVEIAGAKYSGEITLANPSQGLSNVVKRTPVEVRPHNSALCLLWNFEAKVFNKSV
jgi:thiamine pyrophosphokinase